MIPSLLEEKVARGTITTYTVRIESLLARGFSARRKGLGTMIGEVSHLLPTDVKGELTWINDQFRIPGTHFTKMDWLRFVDEYERRAVSVIARLEAISGVKAVPTGGVVWFKQPLNYVGGVLALAVIPIHSETLPAFAFVFGIGMGVTNWAVRYFKTH